MNPAIRPDEQAGGGGDPVTIPRRPDPGRSDETDPEADLREFRTSLDESDTSVVDFEFSDRNPRFPIHAIGNVGPPESIPAAGLATKWMIVSHQELASVDDHTVVRRVEGPAGTDWVASFDLLLPQTGSSEIRKVRIVDSAPTVLMVRISGGVNGELLRTLGVEVNTDRAIANIADEAESVRTDDARIGPAHEFSRPPQNLSLFVTGDLLAFHPSEESGKASGAERWSADSAVVDQLGEEIRAKADRLRANYTSDLNAIDADELRGLLDNDPESGQYLETAADWSTDPGLASVEAEKRWSAMAESEIARELAVAGYTLFNRLFKTGSTIRDVVDELPPGSLFNLTLEFGEGGAASIPWNLLYTRPFDATSGPVDAKAFFGLKYRLNWTKWPGVDSSLDLGRSAEIERLHLMYWGSDEVGVEADRQRELFSRLPGHRTLPGPEQDLQLEEKRNQVVEALSRVSEQDKILHLYCRHQYDEEISLVFGAMANKQYSVLNRLYLGTLPLESKPLVFVNACDSASADDYRVSQLEALFFDRGCRAFLGTEIKVPIQLGSRFSQVFFSLLESRPGGKSISAGEAAALTRRYLWLRYRNIGGLFYTYIQHYGLRIDLEEHDG